MTDYAIMLVSTTSGDDTYKKVSAISKEKALQKASQVFGKSGTSYWISVMTKSYFLARIWNYPIHGMLTHAQYELQKDNSFEYGAIDRLRGKYSWTTLPSRLKKVIESVTWNHLQVI